MRTDKFPNFASRSKDSGVNGVARSGWSRIVMISAALVLAQMVWPIYSVAAPQLPSGLIEVSAEELTSVYGGCVWNCDSGGGGNQGGSAGVGPDPVGSPYWEYSHRVLLARPSVAGDLVWQRINSTNQSWGPINVSYQYREEFNWSIGGGVPTGYVQGQLGGMRSISRTESTSVTVPPRTSYKLYVAYPYERWQYYYNQYQDYDDNSRNSISTGSATVYDQWTRLNMVGASLN